jgi:hypothetical protein
MPTEKRKKTPQNPKRNPTKKPTKKTPKTKNNNNKIKKKK